MLDFDQLISFHLRLRDYVKENPYNQTTAKKNPYSHWRIISNIGSENSAVMFKNNRLNKWDVINGKMDYQQWLNLSSDSNWLPLTNDISNICLVDEWTMMNDKQHQWHFLHFTALVHDLIVQLNTFFMHDYEFWIAFPCSIIRGEIGKITWQSFFLKSNILRQSLRLTSLSVKRGIIMRASWFWHVKVCSNASIFPQVLALVAHSS